MNNSKGFIKVPREVFSLPFWSDPWDTTLWFYCALRVTYRRYGSAKPGQFISSKIKIAEDLNWSWNGLSKHLDSLHRSGCIDVAASSFGVCITLKHWALLCEATSEDSEPEEYVPTCDPNWSLANEQAAHSMNNAHVLHSVDAVPHAEEDDTHQVKTGSSRGEDIQEIKNRNKGNLSLQHTTTGRERDFQIFWEAYPRHENESQARSAYLRLDVPLDRMLQALEKAKQSRQWTSGNGRFIPNAVKWLNGIWRDYMPKEEDIVPTVPAVETDDEIIRRERSQWKRG